MHHLWSKAKERSNPDKEIMHAPYMIQGREMKQLRDFQHKERMSNSTIIVMPIYYMIMNP